MGMVIVILFLTLRWQRTFYYKWIQENKIIIQRIITKI